MNRMLITILIALLTSASLHAFEVTYKGVDFKCKTSGKEVTITGFTVKASYVVIPATVLYKGEEYRVKTVSTFLNGVNYLAETLILEEGIEVIGNFSFCEFRKLKNVSLPASIRRVGKNAFRKNGGMIFNLPSSLTDVALLSGKEIIVPDGQTITGPSMNTVFESPKDVAVTPKPTPKPKPQPIPKPSPRPASQQILTSKQELADVDVNIPVSAIKKNDTYCVIIANEQYEDVPKVDYAERDGEIFKEYCVKTLGVPEKQIKTFINASYTDIKRAMNWMETISNITNGEARFIFYYAGHGLPSEKDQTAYLIPTDGFPKDVTTCYKLSDLYARMGKIKTKSVVVFMDACFSGVKRGDGQALIAARGVAIKTKKEMLSGNTIVFSAASGDETALSYESKRHGMFTYFLLSKLQKSKGKITFGELYDSISNDVKKNSYLENDKLQTPSINVSPSLKGIWEKLYF